MFSFKIKPIITSTLPFGWGDGEPPTPDGEEEQPQNNSSEHPSGHTNKDALKIETKNTTK